jgi:hypothetical protein
MRRGVHGRLLHFAATTRPSSCTGMCPRSHRIPGRQALTVAIFVVALADLATAPASDVEPQPTHGQDDDIGLGPLRIASQSPGQSLRLGLVPHTPSDLRPGEWEVSLASTWVNVWADGDHYHLDYETDTTALVVAHGVAPGWRMEAEVNTRVTGGGRLDSFIQDFHDAFGLSQNGRDQVPRNRASIHIDATAQQPALDLGPADLQGSRESRLRTSLERSLLDGSGWLPRLSLSATAQVPLESEGSYQGGSVDVGGDLAAAFSFGELVAYLTVAYTRFGSDRSSGVRLYRSNWSGLAALEYRLTRHWSALAQYLVSQGTAPDYHVFSKASHEVTFGTKVLFSSGTEVHFALIENIIIFDNSPDFGIHLGLSQRF